MQGLFKRLKPYAPQIAAVVVLTMIQAASNLYLPDLNADIINEGIAKNDIGYIWRVGALMLAVTALTSVCSVTAAWFAAKTSSSFGRDLRLDIFKKVQSLSQSEIEVFGTPSLITRNTNDIQQVQALAQSGMSLMLFAPVMLIGGILMALRQDVPLAVTIAVIMPFMAVVIALMMRIALPLFKSMQKKIDRINLIVRERLSGIRVIRAFVREQYETSRFDEANRDLADVSLKVNRIMALGMPLFSIISNLSTLAVLWFGSMRIESGEMPIGNLTAFITYIMHIMMSMMFAVFMFTMIPRAAASAERISAVLHTQPTLHDPEKPRSVSDIRGMLEFCNVEFRYTGADRSVLSDISFTAFPGETTALIGSTGCGKSTLVNLVPRLYDVSEGCILLDGLDIRDMSQHDLRRHIGFVPQKAFLFTGTIADNLRYGKPEATEEEIVSALKAAQAWEFVEAMPEGILSEITQGGSNLSGGQKQRIAIARALVRRPSIYIFDDSFSALDFRTDAALRRALREETRDSAVLIVAQRVSTIMHADRIIVLEEGRIAGIGRHAELMQSCEVYAEIVYSQHSKEELA